MTITIKNISGRVLYTAESATDVRSALIEAVKDGAYLRDAYLGGAYLGDADLRGAYLHGADLRGAYLRGADLHGANLRGADLRGAKGADLAKAQTSICPDGELIGWKKARGARIVKLRIPEDAKRSNASGRKCRAEYAEVLAITDHDGNPVVDAFSQHDEDFRYVVGETVRPDSFDEDRWNECAPGIHFYITRAEAEAHL